MERPVVAEVIVLVTVVDINLLARRAGPQAVHLVIGHAPRADGLREPRQMRLHLGMRQVEARAAPRRVIRLAIVAFHEPVLAVFVFGVLVIARERQPPEAERQTGLRDFRRHRRHAVRVGAVRSHPIEAAARAVELRPVLPLVINLHDTKSERLQFPGRKLRQFHRGFFVPGLAVFLRIPRAIDGRRRRQLDGVLPLDRVGVKLRADPRVVENADRQRLDRGRLPGGNSQVAVINLRLELDLTIVDAGEQHAAAAILRDPAGHHAAPRRRDPRR